MRGNCGVLDGAFWIATNMPTFSTLFLARPVLGIRLRNDNKRAAATADSLREGQQGGATV